MEELCRPLVAKAGSVEGKGPQAGFLLTAQEFVKCLHIILQTPGTEDPGRVQAGGREGSDMTK